MDERIFMLLAAPVIILITVLLLRWKFKRVRTYMERYIAEKELDAEIEKVGIPPLRLWLRNRKGDGWVKLRSSDGKVWWARVRTKMFGGTPVDFFD